MIEYKAERIVSCSQKEVFDVIADVEKYPEFVPFCKSIKTIEINDDHHLVEMSVGKGFFKENYTSKVFFKPHNEIISLVHTGPLKTLKNVWSFEPLEDLKTKVNLYCCFEISSSFLQVLMVSKIEQIGSMMIEAFGQRLITLSKTRE